LANLEENLGAANIQLSEPELKELSATIRSADVVGDRYANSMLSLTLGNTPPLA